MRASRLLAIQILLQVRGRMSATELAEEFEVSVRTIHRDVDQLSAAGVPVFAERGRTGGFRLQEGYTTRLTGFTAEEAQLLLLSGLGAVASELGVSATLTGARAKLAASLPPEQGARAERFASRFLLDPGDWYRSRDLPPLLQTVAEAVLRERRLRIDYEGWERRGIRRVDPLGLVLKSGTWYLVAAARGLPRTYRVSSIRDALLLDEPALRPRRFRLDRYWHARVREFEASLLGSEIQVRLTPRGADRISRMSAAAGEALRKAERSEEDGCLTASVPVESFEQAIAQLLQLGEEVEVIGPEALRSRLAREGARLVALYGTPGTKSPGRSARIRRRPARKAAGR